MKKIIKQILILACLVALLVLPYFVFAQKTEPLKGLENVQTGSGYGPATPTSMAEIAGTVVKAFLGLLGIIFITLIIYGGYIWMTARGEEAKVEKAQDTIRRSIIGLIIVVGAYAIWLFIFQKIIL